MKHEQSELDCKVIDSSPLTHKTIRMRLYFNYFKELFIRFNGTVVTLDNENGPSMFYGEEYLESITLPKSIQKIGYSAFYNCIDLRSITVAETLTS